MEQTWGMEHTGRLDRGDGVMLAWAYLDGAGPTIVFLPGFASDMNGSKATALRVLCEARGQALLLLDYSGHGASGGAFTDGSIGRWTQDALADIAHRANGKLLLVGSSMGGWIALLVARALPGRIAGLVGIAAAPDFTETLLWPALSDADRVRLLDTGQIDLPNPYGAPTPITRRLIEDGRHNLVLDAPIPLACPVRLLQGQQDNEVPWQTALTLAARLDSTDVHTTLIKDGDHRLSRPQDLALLEGSVLTLLGQDGA